MSLIKHANKILSSRKKFFTNLEIKQLLEIESTRTLENIVKKLTQEKILFSLEKGKYMVASHQASNFEIAQFFYSPSYISFETALNYHGILSQFPLEVTSATTKKRTTKKFGHIIFSYSKLKLNLFTGYYKIDDFLIASPEKALFDQLYMIIKSFKTAAYLDEMDYSNVNLLEIKKYLNLVSKKTATSIGNLLEKYL